MAIHWDIFFFIIYYNRNVKKKLYYKKNLNFYKIKHFNSGYKQFQGSGIFQQALLLQLEAKKEICLVFVNVPVIWE